MQRHFRSVPLDDTMTGVMFAIFDQESEYCAPCFKEYAEGLKQVFTGKTLSIPVAEEDTLLFVL